MEVCTRSPGPSWCAERRGADRMCNFAGAPDVGEGCHIAASLQVDIYHSRGHSFLLHYHMEASSFSSIPLHRSNIGITIERAHVSIINHAKNHATCGGLLCLLRLLSPQHCRSNAAGLQYSTRSLSPSAKAYSDAIVNMRAERAIQDATTLSTTRRVLGRKIWRNPSSGMMTTCSLMWVKTHPEYPFD